MTVEAATPCPPLVGFLRARLERRNENAFWLSLSLFLGAVASAAFLAKAALVPAGIQSDAQMFLAWMGRFDDPALLSGDLVADYWQSVSPWFYRGLFRAAWAIGIEPVSFARLLPAILFPFSALFSFRFLRSIGAEPLVACITTGIVIVVVAHGGSVVSATPRAFRPVLFLMLLDGLGRRNIPQSATAQLLMAASYPQMALVDAAVIGMTLLRPRTPFVRLDRRSLVLVAVCAAATVAGILPFLLQSEGFGPIVTLDGARHIPTFGPTGRNRVFEPDGSLDFVCNSRLGMLAGLCRGPADPRLYLFAAVLVAGPAILALRLRRGVSAAVSIRSTLPLFFLLSCLLWFAIAAAVLFRLHLPSRYTAIFPMLAVLTVVPLLVERIRDRPFPMWLVEKPRGRAVLVGGSLAGLAALIGGAASVPSVMKVPNDPRLVAAIAALPQGAVTAGFAEDLNFSPVLTRRPALFSRELTIGYQLGFLEPILRRMGDMRDVILAHDPAVVADRLRRNGVAILLVPPDTLRDPEIPKAFRGFFDAPALQSAEAEARAGGPTALSRLAPRCTLARFREVDALDASCLIAAAQQTTR